MSSITNHSDPHQRTSCKNFKIGVRFYKFQKRKNKSYAKDQGSELFQTSHLHHWKLKDNGGMTPNSAGKLFPAWNALSAKISTKCRIKTFSDTKVLKNFTSHALFLRKLLETVFHQNKGVNKPRKWKTWYTVLGAGSQELVTGVLRINGNRRASAHQVSSENSPDWSSVTQEIEVVLYAFLFSS